MPGVTLEMLEQGALHADAEEIEAMVEKYVLYLIRQKIFVLSRMAMSSRLV